MKYVKWFLAGAVAVPFGHQIMLWILNLAAFTSRKPFPMASTEPFGIPTILSLSFWGGVWGIILGLVLSRTRGAAYWLVALLFGAIAPTLVAGLVVAPLKGQPIGGDAKMILTGLLVNAAWGLVAAAVYWLFGKK
jgi:hypothetical protein